MPKIGPEAAKRQPEFNEYSIFFFLFIFLLKTRRSFNCLKIDGQISKVFISKGSFLLFYLSWDNLKTKIEFEDNVANRSLTGIINFRKSTSPTVSKKRDYSMGDIFVFHYKYLSEIIFWWDYFRRWFNWLFLIQCFNKIGFQESLTGMI